MDIQRDIIVHDGPGGVFEGMAVHDVAAPGPRPGVLLIPNVLGTKESDFAKAEQVAALGYTVFVADLFGQGNRASRTDPDIARYTSILMADRALLRDRLTASLAVLAGLPGCDPARLAAIGYCFGGLCVLDMARAGMDVRGVVSFHGIFHRPDYANVDPIRTKVLVCHGWNDPLAPPDAVLGLASEMTESGADWQLHAYGHVGHAFTDTNVNAPGQGMAYDENADRRSWANMVAFLESL